MITCDKATFRLTQEYLRLGMKNAPRVEAARWQGIVTDGRPDMRVYELPNVTIEVPLGGVEDLEHWREDIRPHLPWADDHFKERVGGEPLNPGVQWENWPWSSSAGRFRDDEQFNHTYMERYWPKHARQTPGGRLGSIPPSSFVETQTCLGLPVGDLRDLVDYLVHEPTTRQAWIPIFHPNDTGYGDGGRKPCTLGYQFTVRDERLNVWYPLRSCDLVRHYSDDVYLTVRLLLWVLEECRKGRPEYWDRVKPGMYAMFCTSLHVFENDRRSL